jgi:hypothetical protein
LEENMIRKASNGEKERENISGKYKNKINVK